MTNNTQIARTQKSLSAAAGRLARDEKGATIVEYLVIVGLIAIAAIAIFSGEFFGSVRTAVTGQSGQINTLATN